MLFITSSTLAWTGILKLMSKLNHMTNSIWTDFIELVVLGIGLAIQGGMILKTAKLKATAADEATVKLREDVHALQVREAEHAVHIKYLDRTIENHETRMSRLESH
jgi:hypothetical protein